MQISFDLTSASDRQRVRRILDEEDKVVAPQPSTTQLGDAWFCRLLSSRTGQIFLKPVALKPSLAQGKWTAAQIDGQLGLRVGCTQSYIKGLHKYCHRHGLKFVDFFTTHDEHPKAYTFKVGMLEKMRASGAI